MLTKSKPTIDLCPWPQGLGFSGNEEWWLYVRRQTEDGKLELLTAMALLDNTICERLLTHDKELFDRFEFSGCTLECLATIQVNNLEDFAAALVEQRDDHTLGYLNDDYTSFSDSS